jgi:hypothetical protein
VAATSSLNTSPKTQRRRRVNVSQPALAIARSGTVIESTAVHLLEITLPALLGAELWLECDRRGEDSQAVQQSIGTSALKFTVSDS